ncbi:MULTISPECIES: DgsA anti-repressor MtfA [unclassified Brenneria]|uniref:DgsA anti-repressor MtfA n=1 Tax=unclassified Brenneria TaxID=2634434 RepID=UPI0029C359D2|nr:MULTISPECIES: DgsA anti-repressor MtfA [unclassified Brenneria]MDX5627212.1 DgsA anti-repressor MtfA [Brenneria sp. L3-3Z]MDX5694632.1 DgsA anti-repressor MtfA [Brenneria sp. L4-2C]
MIKWPWKTNEPQVDVQDRWQSAMAIPLLAPLSDRERTRLVNIADQFLKLKRVLPLQGLALTDIMQQRIALLFALPILELGIENLDGFHDVLIYPAPFTVDDEWQDEYGLVHTGKVVQSGQSWDQGPIILNWQEIQDSFDLSGFNLVIHEVAHKLDLRGGGMSTGVPLIALRDVALWEQRLHAAMESLQEEIDLVGEDAASMDPYAAQDPVECFAVLSEYFFSAPALLQERFPLLYQCFTGFYRQDPLTRLKAWQNSTDYQAPVTY